MTFKKTTDKPEDEGNKNIANLMKNLALNLKAETETRKAIK